MICQICGAKTNGGMWDGEAHTCDECTVRPQQGAVGVRDMQPTKELVHSLLDQRKRLIHRLEHMLELKVYGLDNARQSYFGAGGQESDLGPRQDAEWYWRRAAMLWEDKARAAAKKAGATAIPRQEIVEKLHDALAPSGYVQAQPLRELLEDIVGVIGYQFDSGGNKYSAREILALKGKIAKVLK